MGAQQGRTDTTLKLSLEPFALRVAFLEDKVSVGGTIGVEVLLINVADGAEITVHLLDGNASKVGKVQGKVYSGIFRARARVETGNSSGLLIPLAELSAYGLEMAGQAVPLLPEVRIENLKWMDAEGSKEIETVVRGQRVTLVAEVTKGPMDAEVQLDVTASLQSKDAQASKDASHGHSHEPVPEHFLYQGNIKSKKFSQTFLADWEVSMRKAQLEFTINLFGVTSEPSKKVKYVAGIPEFST